MKKKKYLSGHFSFKTDIGKVRLSNEDQATALINTRGNVLLLVCDGMGGQNRGEFASNLAVRVISDAFKNKSRFFSTATATVWLKKVIREANKAIYDVGESNPNYKGMGTTLTAVLVISDTMIVAQVGDSRAYSYRVRTLEQLTEDQSYVAFLYRTGQIKKEEMKTHPRRHVLTNALGIYPSLELDVKVLPYRGDTLLLCSDGLYNNVSESDIASIIRSNDSPEQKTNELISLANVNGGSDNIAVALWEGQE